MASDVEKLILEMLRSLDDKVTAHQADMLMRVAVLETHDHDISGNGQPGRMASAEKRIGNLEKGWWKLLGGAAVAGAVGSGAFAIGLAIFNYVIRR